MTQRKPNTMGGDTPRRDGDAYLTPDPLALAIAQRIAERVGHVRLVIEPSAGAGSFVRAARSTWPGAFIHAVEPDPQFQSLISEGASSRYAGRWEEDGALVDARRGEVQTRGTPGAVLILGNPPYNLPEDAAASRLGGPVTAERHVVLALERLAGLVAFGVDPSPSRARPMLVSFLLRQSFAATPARFRRLWSRGGLRWRDVIVGRPSFTGGGTDGAEYELFTWQVGYTGAAECGWIEWTPERQRRAGR